MAKQQKTVSAKKPSSTGVSLPEYLGRNAVVVIAIAFVLFLIDKKNENQSQLQDMYQEFQQLRQTGGSQQRMEELYREINEIQSDTSFLTRTTRGYHWAIHDMALGSLKSIEDLREQLHLRGADSTAQSLRDAKLGMKVGVYPYMKMIEANTPKDAVILLPPADTLAEYGKWNFIYDTDWVEYFIYPRLCVSTGREDEHPDLAGRITHVLVVDGFAGWKYLKYDLPVEQRPKDAILPVDKPPVAINQ